MSTPSRIDSPIPSFLSPWSSYAIAEACAEDRDDGASTPRASTRHSSPAPMLPTLRLPVCHGTPPRSHLGRCLGPALSQHLMPVSSTRYETQLSWDSFDALIDGIWQDVRPQALAGMPCRARLLRPEDDVARYLQVMAHATEVSELSVEDFAWLVAARLRQQHYTIVIEHEGTYIATAAMLIETRIAASQELVGHLDDISVTAEWQSVRLGASLVTTLTTLGDTLGIGHYAVAYDWRQPQVTLG